MRNLLKTRKARAMFVAAPIVIFTIVGWIIAGTSMQFFSDGYISAHHHWPLLLMYPLVIASFACAAILIVLTAQLCERIAGWINRGA